VTAHLFEYGPSEEARRSAHRDGVVHVEEWRQNQVVPVAVLRAKERVQPPVFLVDHIQSSLQKIGVSRQKPLVGSLEHRRMEHVLGIDDRHEVPVGVLGAVV
jgi:hypothetical protein